MNNLIPTIGIECHVQLKTKTKLFAGVGNDAREADPNTLVSPICFGMPGTLPVLNEHALKLAIRAGIALNATIPEFSKFDRKHYFYPDLPKGYQITQYDQPIILDGKVEGTLPNGEPFIVRVERAHLEEDAGKSTHPDAVNYSLVDLNRAGTPLLEIVSKPDMHSSEEAKAYARELYLLMKYADVSEADLYYGNMRFDVNVSLSGSPDALGTRTETKNLNSFRAVEKAIDYEIKRQSEILLSGGEVIQETRGWDDSGQKTFSQRTKEDAHDYRYFPEPDIPPIIISPDVVEGERKLMPPMPQEIRKELSTLNLDRSQLETLIEEPDLAILTHRLLSLHDKSTVRYISNWLTGEIQRLLVESVIQKSQVIESVDNLVVLASMVDAKDLNSSAAKELLSEVILKNIDPKVLAKERNLIQVSDESELILIVERVISENDKAANDVRSGENKAIGFLVGQVMKETSGKANPGVVASILMKLLSSENK